MRCVANSRYSIRAFARQLKVDPSHLAKVIKGEVLVSRRYVEWAGKVLSWSESDISRALTSPDVSDAKAGRRFNTAASQRFTPLTHDCATIASSWLHYIILEMTHIAGFSATVANLVARIGRDREEEVISALQDLVKLGAIAEFNRGVFRATKQLSSVQIPGTSEQLKNIQREILHAALCALDDIAPENRDQSGIVMAIDPAKIPEAKEKIRNFRRELMNFLESGEKSRVYQLSVSLFPVEDIE